MLRNDAIENWKAGVAAVHGRTLVENAVQIEGPNLTVKNQTFNLDNFDRILIVGGGKFSHFMAEGIENALGPQLSNQKKLHGLVTVPDGSNEQVSLNFIESAECRPAGENLPTQRVLDATKRILGLLETADNRTLVLALISGGGSALLEDSTLPLADIIAATNWLSSRGADIIQINAVRIAMSNLKGGGLPRAMTAGTLVGLIVSDVPNDDYRFVSSGPTFEFGDELHSQAKSVLCEFGATSESGFPATAIAHVENGSPPKKTQAEVFNFQIGDSDFARDAAISKAIELGNEILPDVLSDASTCEQIANAASNWFSGHSATPQCVISLGEPIVETGERAGQGGRNQHAVLTAISKLIGDGPTNKFCFMSAGTDGEDGNTSVAGAIVTDSDLANLSDQSAEISDSFERFDSHTFLAEHGLVFDSGPTGTNVADLRVLLRG